MKTRTFFPALGAFVVLFAATGRAQDQWAEQVKARLYRASVTARQQGRAPTHTPAVGILRPGVLEDRTFYFTAGTEYEIIGVCDNDCADLDIQLYDPQGGFIAQDLLTDNVPVLIETARTTGTYTVRVKMVSCGNPPCRYGVGVYGPPSTSGAVAGQDQWAQEVRSRLDQVGDSLGLKGLQRTHDPYVGSLRTGESFTLLFQLKQGLPYHFVALGDHDCTDLDLRLYDPQNNLVASDTRDDAYPVVSVTPGANGTYSVKVSMVTCNDQPCRYGVSVFGGTMRAAGSRSKLGTRC